MDTVMLTWFVAATALVLLVGLIVSGRPSRADERMSEFSITEGLAPLGDEVAPVRHESGGSASESEIARRLREAERRNKLKARIVQAGLYGRNATMAFFFLRTLAVVVPVGMGLSAGILGSVPLVHALVLGVIVGLSGLLLPSFWLDFKKRARQESIRRALPDALDVIAVCLEGGMSLSAALSRVARELATAHPMLALELAIVERETQMGRTTGQALREFANRFDLEELRSLASIVGQAERFGTSVTRAMEVYSETLRQKRHHRAEELAQKAVVKIIFPTLFCIFPGIFIVVLGPAAIQIYQALIKGALSGS